LATLKAGVDKSPDFFSYEVGGPKCDGASTHAHYISQGFPPVWTPRIDGVFLQDNPQKLVKAGKVAKIPFVTGMYFLPSSHLV
jgi:hypothetical protein